MVYYADRDKAIKTGADMQQYSSVLEAKVFIIDYKQS